MVILFCLSIIVAVIVGITFPGTGKYTEYIPYFIGLMLFFNFLDVKINWMWALTRRSVPDALAGCT